jgi:hypothetical protein
MSSWLDAIEARVKAATPGPWAATVRRGKPPIVDVTDLSGRVVIAWPGFDSCDVPRGQWAPNAQLIAHAPADLRALLACVRALGEALETIAIREHPDHFGSRRVAKTALTLSRTGPTPPAEETR